MIPRRIAVYVGPGDALPDRYVLALLCDRWRDAGSVVDVIDDPAHPVKSDAAVMHVDATVRPEGYQQLVDRHPCVVNGRVRDISKRRVSTRLVARGSSYEGPVIVKTDANCFGWPDHSRRHRGGLVTRALARVLDRLAPIRRRIRTSGSYPVFPDVGEVPRAVWWDPALVVEKFLPERRNGYYCLRTWLFCGSRERAGIHMSENPIVKRSNIVESEELDRVPKAIRAARDRLGFDYGKFDFVIHDGDPVLLDANSTPTTTPDWTPRLHDLADELAPGLYDLLE